ncbi:MAG TPA: hypothetical protein VF609_10375 [Flavisolibacter sp.]|jgi:hypothetical protein
MSSLELKVYEIFKSKLGEHEAEVIMDFLDRKADEKIQQKKDVFLTKDDKVDLVSKIESAKTDTIKWMFIFWIGQLGATIALVMLFIKK